MTYLSRYEIQCKNLIIACLASYTMILNDLNC